MKEKFIVSGSAFTISQGENPRMIVSPVAVFNPKRHPRGEMLPVDCVAQWDTGATHNLISRDLAERAWLEKLERTVSVNSVNHTSEAQVYAGSLVLTHGLIAPDRLFIVDDNLKGTGIDLVIGLDIINNCDFALTHDEEGNVVLSVSAPPSKFVSFA